MSSLQLSLEERNVTASLYVLGDTSYAPCCVDEVAAQHVNSDAIVHFGPTCLVPSRRLPVCYSFGRLPETHLQSMVDEISRIVYDRDVASTLFSNLTWPLKEGESESEEGDDYDEYDEEPEFYQEEDDGWNVEKLREFHSAFKSLEKAQKQMGSDSYSRHLLVLYDRQYVWLMPKLQNALQALGIRVLYDNETSPSSSEEVPFSSPITVVLAQTETPIARTESEAEAETETPDATFDTSDFSFAFSGYRWPVPFASFPGGKDGETATIIKALWNQVPVSHRWRLAFSSTNWASVFISAPSLPTSETDEATVSLALFPSPASSALAENFSLNFSTLNISTFVATSRCSPSSTLTMVSGSREQSRLLARRYYLVEKAKNSQIFGLVVCTLAAAQYARSIHRMMRLIRGAGRRAYLLSVGKVNEPKLLNFPEVECFVMVSCPLSVLLKRQGVIATSDVITPVELEFALGEGREWTGEYSTDFTSVFSGVGRLGMGPVESSAASLAADPVLAKKIVEKTERRRVVSDGDVAGEDDPRFSPIDGKYHPAPTKSSVATQLTHNVVTDFAMVEMTTNGELTEVPQKLSSVYTRTYFGLDGTAEPSEMSMVIQPGLYGTAKGYVSMEIKANSKNQDENQDENQTQTSLSRSTNNDVI